jgi:hypothetical protein
MKLTKQKLHAVIIEVLKESDEVRLKNQAMTGGQFTGAAKQQRQDADAEVDNNERALIHQIDQFLLNLAALPGVDLQGHRTTLQTVLQTLKKRIGGDADASGDTNPPESE